MKNDLPERSKTYFNDIYTLKYISLCLLTTIGEKQNTQKLK